MSHEDCELIASFVTETNEHLADVEHKLLEIEAGGPEVDLELVNTVFRAIHSTKGTAGFLGLHTINSLTHEMENLLNLMRSRLVAPSAQITDLLLRATDSLRVMVNNLDTCADMDVTESIDALAALVAAASSPNSLDLQQALANGPLPTVADAADWPAQGDPTGPDLHLPDDRAAGGEPPAADERPDTPAPMTTSASAGDASIRVSVGILDRLMNLAGELVLGRNQLLQVIERRDRTGLESVGARVDQVTSELQEAIMHSRMQPISNIFGRFSRVVRDLSQQLGKPCELVVEGKDVELDKTIIEAIGDPLIHLIRNALDHGLESPEQRVAMGKRASGTIRLAASHQAGRVNIAISDDGAGIDVGKVKAKAVAKGLITVEQAAALSERDAVRLVFHPGFSTAESITDISGRGVGMDVVKTNIARLGGAVDIETELGRGTTVRVKLPLTLAIIPSLIIRCGDERFAIPQSNINELVRVPAEEVAQRVERVKQSEVLRLRGRLLPLVRLRDALGQPTAAEADHATSSGNPAGNHATRAGVNIIVVEAGLLRYGLAVDGLNDSEEIVVKPLGRHLKDCPCLAGATVLGDGQVALILDIASIAAHMQLAKTSELEVDPATAARQVVAETQKMLLFSNHPAEYFAVPMAMIRRVERIAAEQIESVGGHDLIQYRSTTLPLLSLEHHIKAQPRVAKKQLYVVVFEAGGREVGLIAPTLADIRDMGAEIDSQTFREPGVLGSIVLDNRAIRLIDVFELTALAHPEWEVEKLRHVELPTERAKILLAEDSGFFRRQVASFLESHGHDVITCEDGEIAWNTLQNAKHRFQLVVTDIEMPNLSGFELCRRIKDHPHLRTTPVIALTSLADEASIAQGSKSGVDDYQVKMDRDRLLSAVARLLNTESHHSGTATAV